MLTTDSYHSPDVAYREILQHVYYQGEDQSSRAGDVRSVFGLTYNLDVSRYVPFLTTKEIWAKGVIAENCWFLSGEPDLRLMHEWGVHFWDKWQTDDKDNLDTAYGNFWRRFPYIEKVGFQQEEARDPYWVIKGHGGRVQLEDAELEAQFFLNYQGFDQIAWILHTLRTNPESRRMVLTAWHPLNSVVSSLPACHFASVWNVKNGRLNCHLTQRSADIPIGVPFNIAGYGLLIHLFAAATGLKPGTFSHTLVDAHIYHEQFPGVEEHLNRTIEEAPPTVKFDIDFEADPYLRNVTPDMIRLVNYNPQPKISMPVAV